VVPEYPMGGFFALATSVAAFAVKKWKNRRQNPYLNSATIPMPN